MTPRRLSILGEKDKTPAAQYLKPMRIFRFSSPDLSGPRVGLETEDGAYDLTGDNAAGPFASLGAWLAGGGTVPALAAGDLEKHARVPADAERVPLPEPAHEVWASGVTYMRSKTARVAESQDAGGGDFYDRVYAAERPELFFKATGVRTVGDNAPVRIRRDSTWNVPEPELVLVLSARGEIVGVTIGNDMSSRSIEGENPLYLPQAKTFDGGCAVGPHIVPVQNGRLVNDDGAPGRAITDLAIRLSIARGETVAFRGETSTRDMKRRPDELAAYLFRELTFPHGAFLFTGTGIIPPDDFTLQTGDIITITIEDVGTLTNRVA